MPSRSDPTVGLVNFWEKIVSDQKAHRDTEAVAPFVKPRDLIHDNKQKPKEVKLAPETRRQATPEEVKKQADFAKASAAVRNTVLPSNYDLSVGDRSAVIKTAIELHELSPTSKWDAAAIAAFTRNSGKMYGPRTNKMFFVPRVSDVFPDLDASLASQANALLSLDTENARRGLHETFVRPVTLRTRVLRECGYEGGVVPVVRPNSVADHQLGRQVVALASKLHKLATTEHKDMTATEDAEQRVAVVMRCVMEYVIDTHNTYGGADAVHLDAKSEIESLQKCNSHAEWQRIIASDQERAWLAVICKEVEWGFTLDHIESVKAARQVLLQLSSQKP